MSMRQGEHQQGFTLLEVLLVVALMAIVSTTVVLTLSPNDPQRELAREAQRFAAVMNMVVERAVLTGTEYGVITTDHDYRFVRYYQGKWQLVEGDRMMRPYPLPDDIAMSMVVDELPWQKDDSLFSNDSLFDDMFEEEQQDQKLLPQVFIYSYGEFMPFTATFTMIRRDTYVPPYDVIGNVDHATADIQGNQP